MTQDPLTPQLAKANGDVKKLCEYLAARRGWDLATDAEQSAQDLGAAAIKLDDHLQAMIHASGAVTAATAQPKTAAVEGGTLDRARLVRFASFLRDLDSWLVAQPGSTKNPEAIATLVELETNLSCIADVAAALVAATVQIEEPEPAVETGEDTADDDEPSVEVEVEAGAIDAAGRPLQLILDDTDEKPMVQEFQGRNELTSGCKELVDGFLAAWGIEYSYYNRKKLLERMQRWITSAPEGQVLVLKMKTAEVPYEPYPSYVSRDVLAGREFEKDPWS
jgi:hypothetical protein